MPKYSIIVPVYNAERFLRECVDSVLVQTFTDYELILVDDGSPDNSGAICDEYAEKDVKVKVIHKENGGVSSARNVGIDESSGEYIVFLDSDDFWHKDALSIIDKELNPTVELLSFGNCNYVHKENAETEIKNSPMNMSLSGSDDEAWATYIVKSFFASPCNKVFRSSVIKEYNVKFKEGVVCFEDYIFSLEYSSHISSFKSIETPIYYYRIFEVVNHISKRNWGELFVISRMVDEATEHFIASRGGGSMLYDIRRYTYQAYVTELARVKLGGGNVLSETEKALSEKGFVRAIRSIKPRGKMLVLVSLFIRLGLKKLAAKWLIKRI